MFRLPSDSDGQPRRETTLWEKRREELRVWSLPSVGRPLGLSLLCNLGQLHYQFLPWNNQDYSTYAGGLLNKLIKNDVFKLPGTVSYFLEVRISYCPG